jgi:hypothetical protein
MGAELLAVKSGLFLSIGFISFYPINTLERERERDRGQLRGGWRVR